MESNQVEKFIEQEIELYGDELALEHSQIPVKTYHSPVQSAAQPQPANSKVQEPQPQQPEPALDPSQCYRCTGANDVKILFDGNPNAPRLLISTMPTQQDIQAGALFQGESGQLLDKILEAIDLSRQDFCITTAVKCKLENAIAAKRHCRPFLVDQIQKTEPKLILCMGELAAQVLLNRSESVSELRQGVHEFHNAAVIVTFHPNDMLKDESLKRPTWADIQRFRALNEKLKI